MMNVSHRLANHSVPQRVVFSVVSHGQLGLIRNLLLDMRRMDLSNVVIVLTINITEDEACLANFDDLPIVLIRNEVPKGFGENHNQAFEHVEAEYFVVVNPDIRLHDFSLAAIFETFERSDVGAVAPAVLSPDGKVEDSVRRFPTLLRLLRRVMFRDRAPDYCWQTTSIDVEWTAGMFVAFRREAFRQVSGFDTRYFMYMEDADICRRLKKSGWMTVLQPSTSVVHDAQRASRRNFRHLKWHISSALRFLFFPMRRL